MDDSGEDFRPAPRSRPGITSVITPEPASSSPRHRPAGDSSPLPDDLVTRLLSAQAYLRDSFADRIAADLVKPSRRAMSPLWKVDAIHLARHAARARRLRRVRDVGMATTLGYVLVAGTLVLLLAFSPLLSPAQAVGVWAVLWVWSYVVAVRLSYTQAVSARRSAVAVIYEPQDLRPDPLGRSRVEDNLDDLNRSNVVVFRGDSSPFVGSGVNIDSWSMTLDLSTRAAPAHRRAVPSTPDYATRQLQPDPLTGGELQQFLLERMPSRITPEPTAGHRLYVRGGSNALSVPIFRSGPTPDDRQEMLTFRRPVSRVPDQVIQHYLHDQSEGARVYTWFTHSAWGGQVVVTLFVRAHVSNQTLFVEGLVYALRPLAQQFYSVRGLPTDRRAESSALFRAALGEAPRQFFRAPAGLLATWRSGRADAAATDLLEEEIEGRRDIDFGALASLRERVANYNLADQFAANDERMYYQIFNRRAIETIGAFLDSRHVDLGEFQGQAAGIIGATIANANSIYGSAGSNGIQATDIGD